MNALFLHSIATTLMQFQDDMQDLYVLTSLARIFSSKNDWTYREVMGVLVGFEQLNIGLSALKQVATIINTYKIAVEQGFNLSGQDKSILN